MFYDNREPLSCAHSFQLTMPPSEKNPGVPERSSSKPKSRYARDLPIDPWAAYVDDVVRSCGSSGIDDWYRTVLAKPIVRHINSVYGAALCAASGRYKPDVKLANEILGKNPSHAARQARQSESKGPNSWDSMDAYFPLAVTSSLDVVEFAPPLLEVHQTTLLKAIQIAERSLNGINAAKKNPTIGQLRVATYFVFTQPATEIVEALREGQSQKLWNAIQSTFDRDPETLRRLPKKYQSVRASSRLAIRWCVPVALLSLCVLEELIRELE
jgi:hypothetical protein